MPLLLYVKKTEIKILLRRLCTWVNAFKLPYDLMEMSVFKDENLSFNLQQSPLPHMVAPACTPRAAVAGEGETGGLQGPTKLVSLASL